MERSKTRVKSGSLSLTEVELTRIPTSDGASLPPAERYYRPELDVLRFFAFLAVFVHHCAPYRTFAPSSFLEYCFTARYALGDGLCLFFLLSSYLISELLLRERAQTGTIHMLAFYMRRVLRIWPLYAGFLCLAYVFGKLAPFARLDSSYLVKYIFFAGNWAYYGSPTNNPIGPLWSISVEEQFYFCWPFVAKFFGRRGLLLASASLLPLALAACSVLNKIAAAPGFAIWTSSFTQFECFAVGALLAIRLHGKAWTIPPLARVLLFSGGVALWFFSEHFTHFKGLEKVQGRSLAIQLVGFETIIIGCMLIFLATLGSSALRKLNVLAFLGRRSYGLYVFHVLGFYLAMRMSAFAGYKQHGYATWSSLGTICLGLAVTISLAAASYKFIERPFLQLKDKFTFVPTRVS